MRRSGSFRIRLPDATAAKRIQINTSPNSGDVDFSLLGDQGRGFASFDLVSIADLLRNAFVYPPHSIYQGCEDCSDGVRPTARHVRPSAISFPISVGPDVIATTGREQSTILLCCKRIIAFCAMRYRARQPACNRRGCCRAAARIRPLWLSR
jgi:hypothetical protein